MKKMLLSFSVSVFIAAIILAPMEKASAVSDIDQQHTVGNGSVSIDKSLGRFAQIFMPTKSRLDKVEVELANVSGTKTVDVAIRHRVGTTWDAGDLTTISDQTVTTGWNTFDFNDLTLTLSSNDTYGIFVSANQNGPQWKYKSGPSVYDRGYAIWQNNDKIDWDYNFKTYGYEPAAETTTTTTDPDTSATTTSTDTSSGETLSATTSDTVKSPTSAVAEYITAAGAVKITWTKSTTADVTGYKIYRSEIKTSGFKSVGITGATVAEFMDGQEITAGKTYYYQIRAYKDANQSVSSNTTEILVPQTATTASSTNTATNAKTTKPIETVNVEEVTPQELELYWILGGFAAILFVLLLGLSISRFRAGKHQNDEHFKQAK